MARFISLATLFIFLVGGLSILPAQTGNLYGSGTSDSAVLVRLINAQASGSALLRLGTARLEAPAPGSVGSYHGIAADIYILRYAGKVLEFIPRSGTLYTIVAAGSRGLLILEDSAHTDVARAQIYVYNMAFGIESKGDAGGGSALPASRPMAGVSIRTADGETELFASIVPGVSAHRAVNAVKVQLGVFTQEGRAVSSPFEVTLQRGSSTSVLLLSGSGGVVEVFTVPADIARR